MGRVLLVARLAARNLRRRWVEAFLLLLVVGAASTTLTLGLVLPGATDDPFQRTRDATAGPDVVANVAPPPTGEPADLARLSTLTDAAGVIAHSGPYPVIGAHFAAGDRTAPVQAEGRDTEAASVDQPKLTDGTWVHDGAVVVEAVFADTLDVETGDSITLDGRPFQVAGVAVTAAIANGAAPLYSPPRSPGAANDSDDLADPTAAGEPGLVWMTRADVHDLAGDDDALSYVVNLRLADPAAAPSFVDDHRFDRAGQHPMHTPNVQPWQEVFENASNIVRNERRALVTGAWLLGLLAVASVAVLVGGRLADQSRRVGLLKAVGATPGLVAAVLLTEYIAVTVIAAAIGITVGRLAAPTLLDTSGGLLGVGSPTLTLSAIAIVGAAAVTVTATATLIPALRAARTSTIDALIGEARPPRRSPLLIALSARVPTAMLLALRVAARRPRRMVLAIASIVVTVSGLVAALAAHSQLAERTGSVSSAYDELRADRLNSVLFVITVMLVVLATVNAVFITWATIADNRRVSALMRAFGATPAQVSAGLCAAQALPALIGATLGIPCGLALFTAVSPDAAPAAATPWLVALVLLTVAVVAALTAIPALLAARQPATEALAADAP